MIRYSPPNSSNNPEISMRDAEMRRVIEILSTDITSTYNYLVQVASAINGGSGEITVPTPPKLLTLDPNASGGIR